MRKIHLILGVLLALILINAFSRVPRVPSPGHLAPRYEKASLAETRIDSPRMAILGDYRGFDLVLAAVFCGVAGVTVLLLGQRSRNTLPVLLLAAGTALALGVGLSELGQGSNFLDHEALARWVDPAQARWKGVFWLSWAAGLSLLGAVLAFFRSGDREGGRG